MIRRLDLKVGFGCNNRCRFCVQGDKRSQYPDRTTTELRRLLEEAVFETDEVVLTGGEVTLRADLPELVAHARRIGFRNVQVQTNARRLSYMPYAALLARAGVTEVGPALHGPDAATHDSLTRALGSFAQTVQGIRNVEQIGLPVIVNTVVTRQNLRLLPAIVRLLVELRVDQLQLAMVHPLGSARESFDEVVPRLADARPHVLEALDYGLSHGVRSLTEALPLCLLPERLRGCAAEFSIPRTRIIDATHTIDDYTAYRTTEGKAKGPPCRACTLDPVCEGPWREYPERFGWDDLAPVSGSNQGQRRSE